MRRPQRAMYGVLSVALTALLLGGCVRRYRPPTADQPHAVVKLRRVYASLPGPQLAESAKINEHLAFSEQTRPVHAPYTDSVLIHPGPASWELAARFYHMETRQVQESYQELTPYTAFESYSCGSYSSPRTCSRSVTRYRSQTKYRTVTKQVQVVDDACTAAVSHEASEGSLYLIQLTYQGDGVCRASCFSQTARGDGQSTQEPCP